MSRVTALRLHEDQSCEVWVDGAMLVRTDALLVHEEGLEVGAELEPEDVRRLCTRASVSDAKQRAFLLLGYRPYCGAELKKRLEEEDTQEGVHIGLLNTHKRLELIYGEDYKIRLLSRPGRGTMIELKIRALPWDGHGGGTLSGRQSGAVQTDRKKSPD